MKYYFKKCFLLSLAILSLLTVSSLADELHLKNGDRLSGKLIRMEEGKLIFNTPYAEDIMIQWDKVSSLSAEEPIRVILRDNTLVTGSTQPAEQGKMTLKMGELVDTVSFPLAEVRAINPKPEVAESALKTKGHLNLGFNSTSGNSDVENQHLDGEFIAETNKNRLTIGAEFNRSKTEGETTKNNALGSLKYDYFISEKWFVFGVTSFEKDEFKDLNLRSVLGLGAGYQFFKTPVTNLYVEAGLSYINTDYDIADDTNYTAGRWALNFDRYFYKNIIQFFHFHEIFFSLEDSEDIFLRTRTGFRLPVYGRINATAQYNYDWDNKPSPGRDRADQMYILSLGYAW